MGVLYLLVCSDCKKKADLNKNKEFAGAWESGRIEAHLYGREPEYKFLLYPLLFLRKHWGHRVDLRSDCGDDYGYIQATYDEEEIGLQKKRGPVS